MNQLETALLSKGYRLINGQWYPPDRLAPASWKQPDLNHEPVATDARTIADPIRRFVCVESYRCRLVDRDALWVKYIIDALRYAGILFEDTTQFLEIEIKQIQVSEPRHERTEVIIK